MEIRIKRVYDNPGKNDRYRILVDRLWPRGISKENAKIDYWAKDQSPSSELRRPSIQLQQTWGAMERAAFQKVQKHRPHFVSQAFIRLQDHRQILADLSTDQNTLPQPAKRLCRG